MVTVIIPTLNEQETIASVIKYAFSNKYVSEVLVIDDKSLDNTVPISKNAGASVYTSASLGKGASMREGIQLAQNELLVFLDGDINPYPPKMLSKLIDPLINEQYDFVKSGFDRNSGRVTELVAKPLLSIFFPEMVKYNQPLSGMIAGRKSVLQQLHIPNDYGVDISILIDLIEKGCSIKQVDIGFIENRSRPLNQIGKMSKEVSAAILKKAIHYKRSLNLDELYDFEKITEQLRFSVKDSIRHLNKMMILDMDDTVLQGRFIQKAAAHFRFEKELLKLRRDFVDDPVALTKSIAQLLKGRSYKEFIEVADSIPLTADVVEVLANLKNKGYIIGIISNSYTIVTEHIKNKIGAHFSLSNELEFSEAICTGEVKLPSYFFKQENSICQHSFCKTNAVLSIAKEYRIEMKNIIAMGDSQPDLCMILKSGLGISFCSKNEILREFADITIETPSFKPLLNLE
ncbi:MAG TPA: HAD-IB family phosphatase [Niabella sp.]|nr:HAD-IB family phosphatase [Niabella sp.]HOZ96662.1 HAD-IB family phosphatase [Niabella sp.]HQW14470.1 HAD-IB family phosphatase [Niabella sp.]HQX19885.1 HAD-IB family phosphatase [Niabella sp.]HRB07333.1 HAD-IB family phosphatase [Niabella sp.]